MNLPAGSIAAAVVLALLLGLWLVLAGRAMRLRRGLGGGRTVSLDRVTLTSHRLGLTGRPDRLIKTDGTIIVEEWKSARTLRSWHRAQMGVYFLLVEEELRVRPSHGFIASGDGTRHRVENTEDLRAWVLELAGRSGRRRRTYRSRSRSTGSLGNAARAVSVRTAGRRGCDPGIGFEYSTLPGLIQSGRASLAIAMGEVTPSTESAESTNTSMLDSKYSHLLWRRLIRFRAPSLGRNRPGLREKWVGLRWTTGRF
jgi:CRISPR-associated exonuclease Cas4